MANPAGELSGEVLNLDFDCRLMLQFREAVVTSDAGRHGFQSGQNTLTMDAGSTFIWGIPGKGRNNLHSGGSAMAEQFTGAVEILNSVSGQPTIVLEGGDDERGGNLILGGNGQDGDFVVADSQDGNAFS